MNELELEAELGLGFQMRLKFPLGELPVCLGIKQQAAVLAILATIFVSAELATLVTIFKYAALATLAAIFKFAELATPGQDLQVCRACHHGHHLQSVCLPLLQLARRATCSGKRIEQ